MRKVEMKIVGMREIAEDTFEMQLEDNYITQLAQPGQFIYIAVPNFTLRRAISIADIDRGKNRLTILFKVLGKGTAKLAEMNEGDTLDCIGPNGNGFPLETAEKKQALLVGGGIGVPPLYYLGKALKRQGIEVTAILGYQTKSHVFYEEEFKQIGETIIVTDDGSYGEKGFVTDVLQQAGDFDVYYACGPSGMLQALTERLRGKEGYISLEERMGCGVGACAACVVRTTTPGSSWKICHDGPVFPAREVVL